MKHIIVAATLASTFMLTSVANAATGVINFAGTLSTVTCTALPGAGSGTAPDFNINFGTVAFADLNDSSSTSHGAAKYINIIVDCTNAAGLTTVKAAFDPAAGSGIDAGDARLLSLASGTLARGAGIGILDDTGRVINLSGNDTVETPLVPGEAGAATALITTRAAYVLNGQTPVPGPNTAQLPFTLTFE